MVGDEKHMKRFLFDFFFKLNVQAYISLTNDV